MTTSRIRLCLWSIIAVGIQASLCTPALGQFGKLNDLKKEIEKKVDDVKQEPKQETPAAAQPGAPAMATAAGGAATVFSDAPIDPAKPENLVTSFDAGDHIYGLIQVDKTWRDLLGKGRKDAEKIEVPIDMLVDGKKVDFQYIHIKKKEAMDTKVLVLDIAPEPDKMTAYKDPGFFHAEGKGNRKIGPDQYTYILGELSPGKHTIGFQVRSYGDVFSAGQFTIDGPDYKQYTALREKLLGEAQKVATMPEAKKTDKALEANMRELLDNAGWSNVRKLVIIDKDWWLDRESGGDSPIVSRHMDAAACTKADDGSFYWCVVQFHQYKRLDGSFGPLELTHTGDKHPISEENIDK
ncbi:MAG: hypothetical protein JXO22_18015 [Phycisphaerae bacterium]|nr:hypothetical protein [Phycisphaerae bacterium]